MKRFLTLVLFAFILSCSVATSRQLNVSFSEFKDSVSGLYGIQYGDEVCLNPIFEEVKFDYGWKISLENRYTSSRYDNSEGIFSYRKDGKWGLAKSSSSDKKFSLSEQTSYNQDRRTYDRYDSMVSAYFFGNSKASISEVEDWQNQMRSIRKKWETKGKNFTKSSNEDR